MDPLDSILVDPPPGLGPEVRAEAWDAGRVATAAAALGAGLPKRQTELLHACLLLWHDRLDAAHRLVQEHEGDRDADCLHAIMHRREPDESNSRYWWKRVGQHPLATELASEAIRLGIADLNGPGETFRPQEMSSACCRGTLPEAALRDLQACELRRMALRLLAS
jgi:hypothetical protein